MVEQDWTKPLARAAEVAAAYRASLEDRPVNPTGEHDQILSRFDLPLPASGESATALVERLAEQLDDALMGVTSGRFHGWVIGSSSPAAVATEVLLAGWDQNAGMFTAAPGLSALEQVAGRWVKELLGLPPTASFGIVTGAQVANFVCLAAARHRVLASQGWDVEEAGLTGAPRVRVVTGDEVHSTVPKALKMLGLGTGSIVPVATDANGAMDPDDLRRVLADADGPIIVASQAGNIATGALDPFDRIATVIEEARAGDRPDRIWHHVDGAFGLWAAASPRHRWTISGVERADSWCTDGHKTLNTTYDCGIAIVADPEAHHAAMTLHAAYLPDKDQRYRDPIDWNPEMSRRGRGAVLYATLAGLGRDGVVELVESLWGHARAIAARLTAMDGVEILNDVVTNQVLVRFRDPTGADDDAHTAAVTRAVQESGEAYPTPTTWRGMTCMRVSVSSRGTDPQTIERTVAAIVVAHRGSS